MGDAIFAAVSGRLKAIWLLALALIRTFFRRVFRRGREGIAAFRANYDEDRLPPVSAEDRAEIGGFGRCIACGLCDRGETERIRQSDGVYRGVMSLMLAASRSMPDFREAARSFAYVPDSVLAEKERVCPTRVPMRKIARFVRGKAAELGQSLPPGRSEVRAVALKAASATDQIEKTPPKTASRAERL